MLCLTLMAASILSAQGKPVRDLLAPYDVLWSTPSQDSAGSMPIGNGEVVLNVWVDDATGDLVFLIGRTDSLSEISRLLKVGRVRVHFDPSPFTAGPLFRQKLNLYDGSISVNGAGAELRLFVDSETGVVHLTGEFAKPCNVSATLEDWRAEARPLPKSEKGSAWSVHDAPFPLIESADHFPPDDGGVTWYHRNESSVVPAVLAAQSLTGAPGAFDPILHRTFGGRIEGRGMTRGVGLSIDSLKSLGRLDLKVSTYTAQTATVDDWVAGLRRESEKSPTARAQARTVWYWHNEWDRAWVVASDHAISQGYLLQRYVQICQGRGEYPIKFNGGTYTVEPTHMGINSNPDFRNWGDSFWYQNTRHMYLPMLAEGDFDEMDPFFRLYENSLPLAESRTKIYHDCEGAYFPETMTAWGSYSGGDYGWDRVGKKPAEVDNPYWRYAWNQGPELVSAMLDRWDYTRDRAFLQKRVLPMADAVLKYFDTRFKRDDQGRIVLDPAQAIETYWTGVINDMPTTAGLIAITSRLCALPSSLVTKERQAFYSRMNAACPQLPLQEGKGGRELAPAQKYDDKRSNSENPELYAVWPFQLVCLAKPKLLPEARLAYKNRVFHNDVGWGQDGNVAALLGLTDEAARILEVKVHNSHKGYRWPATWGPNYDWLPDQNHGGNLLETTELMLLQCDSLEDGGAIRLLPAWPKKWDVSFKLHAPGNTTVECDYRDGRVTRLAVQPESRRKDVVILAGS